MQSPRLPKLAESTLTAEQRALAESIKSGPRGQFKMSGPFAIYLHSPAFGELAQKLGGHLRFKTSVPPRLSEFADSVHRRSIGRRNTNGRCTRRWRRSRASSRRPSATSRPAARRNRRRKDEMAIYDFVKELYGKRRVSTATFNRVKKLLGDAGTVELVGILGYYAMVSMTLNTFKAPLPEGMKAPFKEGK